jgi:hypothetical protein
VFNLYAKNDDLLQAAHKQWHADCKVAPEDLFRHMLASVWVYVYRAGLPLSEFADAARREELLNGARVLTRYLIDNMAHAQKQDEITFMRLEFQFLPPHAVRKLSKADAATELDEALVKRRQEWQAPPIQ